MDEYLYLLCAAPFLILAGMVFVGAIIGALFGRDEKTVKWQVRK